MITPIEKKIRENYIYAANGKLWEGIWKKSFRKIKLKGG